MTVVKVQRKGALLVCAFALLSLASCGRDARVLLQLRSLSADDPYAGLATLATSIKDGEHVESKRTVPFTGEAFELPAVELVDGLVVDVAGKDAAGNTLARGVARPKVDGAPDTCCVVVCFCSLALYEQGACTCGSPACERTCSP